jgi:hypothetical protein
MGMAKPIPSNIAYPQYAKPQYGGMGGGAYAAGQGPPGDNTNYRPVGAGTYDPMLGFGQASGMGTTYNYPTRYSADYTRYAQSGQPFNQPVMGYNSYGQIFAQPQRPPPTMGKGGGGFRPPRPPPSFGKGGGGYDPNRPIGSPGFPGGGPSIFEPGYQPPTYPGGTRPGSFFDQTSRGQLPPDISGSPFGQLIGVGLGGMPKPIVDPSYQYKYEIPYQGGPVQAIGGTVGQNAYNPAFQQQQQLLAQQQQMSGRAPPGMVRNPNYSPSFSMLDNVPMPGSDEYLRRQEFIPAYGGNRGGFNPIAEKTPEQMRFEQQQYDAADPERARINAQIQKDREAARAANPNSGRRLFQEGGQVPSDAAANMEMMLSETGSANPQSEMAGEYDRLIQMTMQAVLGQTENADEIIQMFIDEFGVDAFKQLRDAVLKQQVPNAQTEGMVDGKGGGMDDQVMGMIGNQRPVAVSPGEYIVPADVVSGLGDGSSKSGADILDELNQAVRMARTGTTEQPRPLAESMR